MIAASRLIRIQPKICCKDTSPDAANVRLYTNFPRKCANKFALPQVAVITSPTYWYTTEDLLQIAPTDCTKIAVVYLQAEERSSRWCAGRVFAAPAVTMFPEQQRAACGTAGMGVSRFRRHQVPRLVKSSLRDRGAGVSRFRRRQIQITKVSRGRCRRTPAPRSRRRAGGKEAKDAVGGRPSPRSRRRSGRTEGS